MMNLERDEKINIKSLTSKALADTLREWGVEGYRFNQVYQWLYQKDAADFEGMTNLSKVLRKKLSEKFLIQRFNPEHVQISEDGTRKYLFRLNDRESVESVLIPNGSRQTLCISSQVGCAMACGFCLTGTLGLTRNLSHFEIVEQIMAVRRSLSQESSLTNIVFMGMGEPLHNFENVAESLHFILDDRGLNFSKNKVTVSTCGLVPQIIKFGKLSQVKLAISLSATTDEIRNQLIPINKRHNLESLFKACREYPLPSRGRITFEYTLLKGVNDSLEDAQRLIRLLQGIPAKVNLIPFNEYPGAVYERTSEEDMLKLQKYLLDHGIQTNIRQSRGRDILGACGQLKAELEPKKPKNPARSSRENAEFPS